MVAAALSCGLALFSQVASTPIGEGMDVDGHLAYVTFVLREGRPPMTGEPALPSDVANIRAHGLASDYVSPGSYARWASSTDERREAERRAWLTPDPAARYVSDNYEAQHPPLYYFLAAGLDRPFRHAPYDWQVFWMSAWSAVLAALAIPALFLVFERHLGARPALALVTAVAWYPNLMPFLGRVTNDALAFPILCWWTLAIDRPTLRKSHVVAGAALLVAGLLTKTYFLAMVPAFLAVCLVRGDRRTESPHGRPPFAWPSLVLGAGVLVLGVLPLVLANHATTGLYFPLYEARYTAGEPAWRKVAGLFMVDPVRFPVLMARGFFWSGYWSWVAPGPWYYLPMLAPLALFWPGGRGTGPSAWWRVTAERTWPHLAAWATFLAAVWWHAGLMALHARTTGTPPMGAEGWYLNVLAGSTALVLAVAVRERVGEPRTARVLAAAAAFLVVWNLVARLALIAFWGGSVRLWSGLRFARLADLARALAAPGTWDAWRSWPGVVGPPVLTIVIPLIAAVVLSAVVLADARR